MTADECIEAIECRPEYRRHLAVQTRHVWESGRTNEVARKAAGRRSVTRTTWTLSVVDMGIRGCELTRQGVNELQIPATGPNARCELAAVVTAVRGD